jgi:nascent polypeptide-associated complex subunit beta
VKKVVKSTVTNDNQLIHVLRKSGAQPVPGIDEVNFFKDDNSIIHFERPEGLISY